MLISLFLLKHKLQLVFPFIFQRATTVQDRWDVGNFWDEYIPYPICRLLAPLSLGKSGARRLLCALEISVGLCVQAVSIHAFFYIQPGKSIAKSLGLEFANF